MRVYVRGAQVWVGTFPTKREAREAERRALTRPRAPHNETCDEFGARWLQDFPRERASTNRTHGYAIRPFVEAFAGVRMADVTRREARAWALAHKSSLAAVRAMFTDALDEGLVTENPFARLGLPTSRGRKDLEVITEDELHEVADMALHVLGPYGSTFRACILFAAYVGLRPAEMFMLRWADISSSEVRITRSLGNTGEVTRPKNGQARTVVLPPPALEALRGVPRRTDSPYIFTTRTGRQMTKSSHYDAWKQVRAAAGRPDMDLYDLRHFCATHLLELGLSPADVAVQLGHTDGGALVMSTYGHPSDAAARDRIRKAFEQSFGLRLIKPEDGEAGMAVVR